MVVKSNNGKKDIELQFNAAGDAFRFEELRLGGFCDELFDCNEVTLADDLIRNISEIQKGLFSKLPGAQKQYEIDDWNTYQRIVKYAAFPSVCNCEVKQNDT